MSETSDETAESGPDKVRRGLLTRTIYQVLADASAPMRRGQVLQRVAESLALNDRELSKNPSDQLRWHTAASAALSRSTSGGWLERDAGGGYSITDDGRDALASLAADELWLEVNRRYQASNVMGSPQGAGWEPFLAWGREFTKVIDLDAEERNYKIKASEKWAAAGEACAAGSTDWAERLKQAAGAGNLVDPFAQTWLRNRIQDHPDEVRAAFGQLHSAGSLDAIADFERQLDSWGEYVSPGDRTMFASCVLMGVDASSYPPYRPTFAKSWADRVGEAAGSTPHERYSRLVDLCDGLLERWVEEPLLRDRLDAQGLGWAALKWTPPDRWLPFRRAELQQWRDGVEGPVRVDRGAGICPAMEAAAWEVLGAGLRGETSALVSGIRSWSVGNAQDLAARLETGTAGQSFAVRLAQQLEGAADGVLCLAAEMLYLRDAPLHDMKAATKVTRVGSVLSFMTDAPVLPANQGEGLDGGSSFNGGQGYHTRAPEHLQWLCRFVTHWLEQTADERDDALKDPFAFREITAGTPSDSPSIRYVIEYLAWPGVFPSIVSASHRRKIRDGVIVDLGDASGDGDDEITKDLVALRTFHERKQKGFVDWYAQPYVNRWRPGSHAGPRAWLVRADVPEDMDAWIEEGIVGLRDGAQLSLSPDLSLSSVASLVADGYSHLTPSQRDELATAMHVFLQGMHEDDMVVALAHEHLVTGTIEGGSSVDIGPQPLLTRAVHWSEVRHPMGELPVKLAAALEQEGHVVDLTAVLDLLSELADDDAVPSVDVIAPEPPPRVLLPSVPPDLANDLHMPVMPLQELVDLLNRRRQLVVYGPPGTGKTYVAKKLAERLAGAEDPSRVRLVQFHPSYAYEDFFEGFRPVEKDGQAHFALQDGPLKLMAAEAGKAENRAKPYVMIIDELNRANLAKVFGELYFLLEYREETVRLQYRPDKPFSLPDNLFIIGTMNTADRSIALVDAAIRRRFPFYEMHPQREPVKGVLAEFAKRNGVTDDRVALLSELNVAMGQHGHDLHIGPSYLMRDGLGEPGALDLVWRYDILPLLHEHFYGSKSPESVDEEFGLSSLRKRIENRAAESPDVTEGTED